MIPLLWMITAILALVWMFGSAINIGGWIHLLLFVNAVVLVFNLLTPRGAPALLEAGNQP